MRTSKPLPVWLVAASIAFLLGGAGLYRYSHHKRVLTRVTTRLVSNGLDRHTVSVQTTGQPDIGLRFVVPNNNRRIDTVVLIRDQVKPNEPRSALQLRKEFGLRALDVSETGVRLVLKEALPVGHAFEVEIEGPAMKPFKAVAEVRRIVKAEDGTFLVGASFDKSVGHAHLSALVR